MRKTGSNPTPDQQRDIALKWARLQERIDAFKRQAANILQAAPDGEDYAWDGTLGGETYFGTEFNGIVAVLLCAMTKQDKDKGNCQDISQSVQGGDKSRQTYQSLQSVLRCMSFVQGPIEMSHSG